MSDLLSRWWSARQWRADHRMFFRRRPTHTQLIAAVLVAVATFAIVFLRWHNGHFDLDRPDERPFLILMCAWIGWALIFRRPLAYRRGWMDGRKDLRSSMFEALLRDMTPEEWMNAELDRDARTLGYDTFDRFVGFEDDDN